jgi:hypothetical protein
MPSIVPLEPAPLSRNRKGLEKLKDLDPAEIRIIGLSQFVRQGDKQKFAEQLCDAVSVSVSKSMIEAWPD